MQHNDLITNNKQLAVYSKWAFSRSEIPEDASKRSNLLTSQSRLSQNRAQLARLPLIKEASEKKRPKKKVVNASQSQIRKVVRLILYKLQKIGASKITMNR